MKTVLSSRDVHIPDDVTLTVASRTVTVTGPRGTLVREFKGNSFAANKVGKNTLRVDMWFGNRLQIAALRTITTHIENMIKGVTKGFVYKMRFAYSHFPINVNLSKNEQKNDVVEIRNFLGESRVRRITLHPGVSVIKTPDQKDEITLEGNDLEKVSGSAALVHESCLVKRKDIRKFLDGLYVSERGVKGATVSLL